MFEFITTALEASVILVLAFLVYRSGKYSFLNRSFSLFLLFLATWILCGFPHLLVTEPSTYFVTLEFRLAHCMAILATGTFFLFSLGFLRGRKPRHLLLTGVSLITALMAFCSLTDLIIKRVSYSEGRFLITNGTMFALFPAFMILFGFGGLLCIAAKRHKSRSIDRARATYILLGFGIFLALAMTLVILVPAIIGSDLTSDYTFFLVLIPTGFTAYAILRHRLLDVRLAVRRSFAYILTLLLFGGPLVLLYAVFRSSWNTHPNLEVGISIFILAMTVALSPAALRWSNKLATKLFFAGLYDEIQLLHDVSSIFTSTANIREGLIEATALICRRLGLEQLLVTIPHETTHDDGDWLIGCRWTDAGPECIQKAQAHSSGSLNLLDGAVIRDDSGTYLSSQDDYRALMEEMENRGLLACLPIKGPTADLGVLLVGEKRNRMAMDPLDLDFLTQFAERAGLFIENYLLSTYLLSQFEELMDMRKQLEESDRFKTDIINVTSHEFRTPLTILNGFAFMLRDHYERFDEIERKQYLGYITNSCDRLGTILDQFLTVSYFQRGEVRTTPEPTPLRDLFEEIKSSFVPEEGQRIESEVVPGDIRVMTDRSYLVLMLKNLVDNAIRYSPQEQPVVLKAEEKGNDIFFYIRDFGQGMDSSEADNIFTPFARLEDTNKHHVGTGLGLYIVRLIADMLGTSVGVESRPHSGTTFFFKLPQA
ncbi:MAG: ATP-binding protein [Actinomycetota bacterium]|nr:ATP-binding protein [Actinomycetota bacterium]